MSLWGPMAMLDRPSGRELIDLLDERMALLGLDPYGDNALVGAMWSAALKVTRMLMPALRRGSRRSWAARPGPRSATVRTRSATTALLAR